MADPMNIGDEVYISYPFAVLWGEKGAAASDKGKSPLN